MSERIEGTIVLDGLIEGPLPSPQIGEDLRQWVKKTAAGGLRFSLAIDGPSFSVLASNVPMPIERLGPDPAERVEDALRDLQTLLPAESWRGLFSTLRSTEYTKGKEIQTLYVVTPAGDFRRGQRTVEASTTAPPKPLGRKDRVKMALAGLVVALAVLAISSIFVDYRSFFRSLREGFTPLNPEGIQVELGDFEPYFTVEKRSSASGGRQCVLTLKRTAKFPLTPEECQRLLEGAPLRRQAASAPEAASQGASTKAAGSPAPSPEAASRLALPSRLAIEALARGYVRCELFGRENDYLGASMERIADLRTKETIELAIPMPADRRPMRIVFGY